MEKKSGAMVQRVVVVQRLTGGKNEMDKGWVTNIWYFKGDKGDTSISIMNLRSCITKAILNRLLFYFLKNKRRSLGQGLGAGSKLMYRKVQVQVQHQIALGVADDGKASAPYTKFIWCYKFDEKAGVTYKQYLDERNPIVNISRMRVQAAVQVCRLKLASFCMPPKHIIEDTYFQPKNFHELLQVKFLQPNENWEDNIASLSMHFPNRNWDGDIDSLSTTILTAKCYGHNVKKLKQANVMTDNSLSPICLVLQIKCVDHKGFLYDIMWIERLVLVNPDTLKQQLMQFLQQQVNSQPEEQQQQAAKDFDQS
ncbi:hypothetical protein L6452_09288 [Arctium lappa]|uniref:Uncharacterized protein n=1 Tax=Arctium lappa TaxID=4217 RepID=A0ACB9DKR7_ARCLA|nr:hypothetical protein L6452_09288 [Arctium lappa]